MTRRTTLFYCYLFLIYTFCVHLPSLNVEVFYMHLYNKEQAIKRMNQLGQLHRPFIFIINYLQDVSYIEEVAAVDVCAHVRKAFGGNLLAQLAHDDLVRAADVDTAQQRHVFHAFLPCW